MRSIKYRLENTTVSIFDSCHAAGHTAKAYEVANKEHQLALTFLTDKLNCLYFTHWNRNTHYQTFIFVVDKKLR